MICDMPKFENFSKTDQLIDRKSIDPYQFSKKGCRIPIQDQKLIQNDMRHAYIREFFENRYIDRLKIDISVYRYRFRTTRPILVSDSSFDRKYATHEAFTIVNIDFLPKSISIDRYINFRSMNVSIFEKFSNIYRNVDFTYRLSKKEGRIRIQD